MEIMTSLSKKLGLVSIVIGCLLNILVFAYLTSSMIAMILLGIIGIVLSILSLFLIFFAIFITRFVTPICTTYPPLISVKSLKFEINFTKFNLCIC